MNKRTDIGNTKWYVWLSLAATLLAILVFVTGKNLPDFLGRTQLDETEVAEQVRLCMQQHGLSKAHAILKDSFSIPEIPGDGTLFAECNWPPQPHSEPDGYSEIKVVNVAGPGLSEAEGSTEIDRFFAPCQTLTLSYSFGNQGNFEHLPSFVAEANAILTPEGSRWQGDIHTLNFYPVRNEIIVVRNLSYRLDRVECVS